MMGHSWVTLAVVALASIATIMLAVVVVQTLLARAALQRLAQMRIATTVDFDAAPPDSLRSCVRSYAVVVDLAATSAVRRAMGARPPPHQSDSGLFSCGGSDAYESLIGTYSDLAWIALQPSSTDAAALYEDLANERVRYIMIAGTYVRAWAWRENAAHRGSFDVADVEARHLPSRGRDLTTPALPGFSMPDVEAGTLVLIVARIDSLEPPDGAGMPSTSACRTAAVPPTPVPVEFPIVHGADARASWDQLTHTALARGTGTLPVHVWGFGGRSTL
jgi:hypothetical protein